MPSDFLLGTVRRPRFDGLKSPLQKQFAEQEPEPEFDKEMLRIGYTDDGEDYYLNTHGGVRVLILGMTRSGKTVLCRRCMDMLYKAGGHVAVIPDAKDEFKSSLKPVQKKFRKFLAKNERPAPAPVQAYRPIFMIDKKKPLPESNLACSIDMAALEQNDFLTLLSGYKFNENQRNNLIALHSMVKGKMSDTKDIFSAIEGMSQLGQSEKRSLTKVFKNIEHYDAFNREHIVKPSEAVFNSIIPILNVRGYEDFGVKQGGILAAFISIWLKELISAWKNRKTKKGALNIEIDELDRWCPKNGEPSCKKVIIDSAKQDAGEGINYIYSTQDIDSVPEELVRQCRYILVPKTANKDMMRTVFVRLAGIIGPHYSKMEKVMKKKRKMKNFQWFVVDRMAKENEPAYSIIKPYFSLSWHEETRA